MTRPPSPAACIAAVASVRVTCHAAGSASVDFHIFPDSVVGAVPFTSNATVYDRARRDHQTRHRVRRADRGTTTHHQQLHRAIRRHPDPQQILLRTHLTADEARCTAHSRSCPPRTTPPACVFALDTAARFACAYVEFVNVMTPAPPATREPRRRARDRPRATLIRRAPAIRARRARTDHEPARSGDERRPSPSLPAASTTPPSSSVTVNVTV